MLSIRIDQMLLKNIAAKYFIGISHWFNTRRLIDTFAKYILYCTVVIADDRHRLDVQSYSCG